MGSKHFAILRDGNHVPDALRGAAVAIGNFDGVHRGHRAVIGQLLDLARARGVPALALTFEPHPRSFFRPEEPGFRLTPPEVKAELLAELGLDGVVEVTFDAALAGLSAEEFVSRILVDRLGVSLVAVGHDFHFGKGRAGSPQLLSELGGRHGFDVAIIPPVGTGNEVFSSSRVRMLLSEGRLDEAAGILGYRWFLRGEVIHGAKRGRSLGFPTANVRPHPGCDLRTGVYAVQVRLDGAILGGVASFGRRPQFDSGEALLEISLFDFSADIYGRVIDTVFLAYLRPELKFETVEALVEQMHADAAKARQRIAAGAEAGGQRSSGAFGR